MIIPRTRHVGNDDVVDWHKIVCFPTGLARRLFYSSGNGDLLRLWRLLGTRARPEPARAYQMP